MVPNPSISGTNFGRSVSIYNDYTVVGATSSSATKGSIYIFKLINGNWTQTQNIIPNTTYTHIYYGSAVYIHENYLIVGAYQHDISYNNMGACYIYKLDTVDGMWKNEQVITPNDGRGQWIDYEFGFSVSINNEYAAIGARYWNIDSQSNNGAVFIFKNDNEVWTQNSKIPGIFETSLFGFSVDINNNNTLVVGTSGVNEDAKVHIYDILDNSYNLISEVDPVVSGDKFGRFVSIYGNYIAVGAMGDSNNSGAVYIYEYISGSYTFHSKLETNINNIEFGHSVSLYNNKLLIGAKGYVYLYT